MMDWPDCGWILTGHLASERQRKHDGQWDSRMDGWKDGWMDRSTDRGADRQIDGQTWEQMDRCTVAGQTNRGLDMCKSI